MSARGQICSLAPTGSPPTVRRRAQPPFTPAVNARHNPSHAFAPRQGADAIGAGDMTIFKGSRPCPRHPAIQLLDGQSCPLCAREARTRAYLSQRAVDAELRAAGLYGALNAGKGPVAAASGSECERPTDSHTKSGTEASDALGGAASPCPVQDAGHLPKQGASATARRRSKV